MACFPSALRLFCVKKIHEIHHICVQGRLKVLWLVNTSANQLHEYLSESPSIIVILKITRNDNYIIYRPACAENRRIKDFWPHKKAVTSNVRHSNLLRYCFVSLRNRPMWTWYCIASFSIWKRWNFFVVRHTISDRTDIRQMKMCQRCSIVLHGYVKYASVSVRLNCKLWMVAC